MIPRDKAQRRLVHIYNRMMVERTQRRYYGDSGFYNFGYWAKGARTQREASEALVDALLDRIPQKDGRILDVACGLGASTKRLLNHYPAENIAAINISQFQIEQARARAPGCDFHVMDATRLDFPDSSFHAVICVEAAFHFDTRDAFLREAWRVLAPGGSLVVSDILMRNVVRLFAAQSQVPRANLLPDIATYAERLRAARFEEVDVQDATAACLSAFRRHLSGWASAEHRAGRLRLSRSLGIGFLARMLAAYFGVICRDYLLVSARKP